MARQAAEFAAGIAKPFGSSGVLVCAYPEMPEVDAEGRSRDPRLVDDALRRSERDLRERADKLEGALGRRLRAQIALGDPAAAILREAEGEKVLVAVGSRGLGPVRRMRLGSVSTKVLRAAKGPVLVYPLEAILLKGKQVGADPAESVEGVFCELRRDGVLRSSPATTPRRAP
jgi:nucleotide-binding universal stress UspA family protein